MCAACHIYVPQIPSAFHLPLSLSLCRAPVRAMSRRIHPLPDQPPSSSFHFARYILFHFISFRFISFYIARPAARYDARMRAVSDVFSFPRVFFSDGFIRRFAGRGEEDGGGKETTTGARTRARKRRCVSAGSVRFYSVVNNIFIAASSRGKTWGAKVQFRGMFAVPPVRGARDPELHCKA